MHASTVALTLALVAATASAAPNPEPVFARGIGHDIENVAGDAASILPTVLKFLKRNEEVDARGIGKTIEHIAEARGFGKTLEHIAGDATNLLPLFLLKREEVEARGVGKDIENVAGDAVNTLPTILKFAKFLPIRREYESIVADMAARSINDLD
ncbi:hypothetical protein FA95DRAFT_1574905 [Auriscalpium vulgare]|uniref:Uncharacterized protein n=1 Tax=Auriscalpium vulgare TaxID=40419 RepID=A0ACB8RJ14_9AGAM|nr:hypothetical protein FA95DRAFT_1574905 [Auriscalpium vulgare]